MDWREREELARTLKVQLKRLNNCLIQFWIDTNSNVRIDTSFETVTVEVSI